MEHSTTAISLVQLPVIEERLRELSDGIDRQVKEAMSLAVTEETVKTVKTVRADLNRQYKELEHQRKAMKSAILEPYDRFMEAYTTYVSVRFEEADGELKRKINAVEDNLKREKTEDLRDYFRELADSEGLGWLEYDRGGFNVTLSKSRTALHKEVDSFVSKIAGDVKVIATLEDGDEISVSYKQCLDLGRAVEGVQKRKAMVEQERREREHLLERKKAEEEARRKVREAELSNLPGPAAPVQEEEKHEPIRTLTFTVTAPIRKLKELKQFLLNGGYQVA